MKSINFLHFGNTPAVKRRNYLTNLINSITMAYKGISDSKLVFDLQDQQQKFSKKLKDLLADYIKLLGLHVF